MPNVKLVREAVTPVLQSLKDLSPGAGFELGGEYYVRGAGPTMTYKGSDLRQVGCIHLKSFARSMLSENTLVKIVFVEISVVEVDEELKI